MNNVITVKGAKENNLKDLSVSIPRNKLIVFTGPSGSGKSTLAMDTLFNECQRQYLESMGLQGISKPKVDSISGLSPAISINQQITNRNPRSTVGTVTDMYTSLRMIYEKIGVRECPQCQHEVHSNFHEEEIEKEANSFKEFIHCPNCDHRIEKLTRTHFSYNTTEGACPTCKGLGETVDFPIGCLTTVTGVSGSGKSSLVFDALAKGNDNIHNGFDHVAGLDYFDQMIIVGQSPLSRMKRSNIATYIDVFSPIRNLFAKLPAAKDQHLTAKHFSFNTVGGRCENCQGLGYVTTNMLFFPEMEVVCSVCHGRRFQQDVLSITYDSYSINDILESSVQEGLTIFKDEKKVKKILTLLVEIGLGYLKMGQSLTTLSGGEGQRLKLAKELIKQGNKRSLYLLDEPTTGLHPNDVIQLLALLNRLVDAGNTVIMVEHNSQMIRASDWVIDLGPEGGEAGGEIIAEGTPDMIKENPKSFTGQYL